MKKNVGSIDKIIRIVIALVISALYITGTVTGILAYVLLALGGILVLTVAVNTCPIYIALGLSTCKKK